MDWLWRPIKCSPFRTTVPRLAGNYDRLHYPGEGLHNRNSFLQDLLHKRIFGNKVLRTKWEGRQIAAHRKGDASDLAAIVKSIPFKGIGDQSDIDITPLIRLAISMASKQNRSLDVDTLFLQGADILNL